MTTLPNGCGKIWQMLPNFGSLALGCMKADFRNIIFVLQEKNATCHLSRNTRLAHLFIAKMHFLSSCSLRWCSRFVEWSSAGSSSRGALIRDSAVASFGYVRGWSCILFAFNTCSPEKLAISYPRKRSDGHRHFMEVHLFKNLSITLNCEIQILRESIYD